MYAFITRGFSLPRWFSVSLALFCTVFGFLSIAQCFATQPLSQELRHTTCWCKNRVHPTSSSASWFWEFLGLNNSTYNSLLLLSVPLLEGYFSHLLLLHKPEDQSTIIWGLSFTKGNHSKLRVENLLEVSRNRRREGEKKGACKCVSLVNSSV